MARNPRAMAGPEAIARSCGRKHREAKMRFDPTFYGGHEIYDDLNDKSWWDGCFVSTNMVYCIWLRDYGKA